MKLKKRQPKTKKIVDNKIMSAEELSWKLFEQTGFYGYYLLSLELHNAEKQQNVVNGNNNEIER